MVLPEEEIRQITSNGQPLTRAQSDLKNGMIRWSIAWVLLIMAAFIVVDFVGDGPQIIENVLSILGKLFSRIVNSFHAQ